MEVMEKYQKCFPKFPSFGFYLPKGWETLFDELCKELTEYVTRKNLIFQITQVKEKFGTLRVYFQLEGNDTEYIEVQKIVDKYEKKSSYICEVCGVEGKIRNNNGWVKVLCESHM